jgi:hypothetical protein
LEQLLGVVGTRGYRHGLVNMYFAGIFFSFTIKNNKYFHRL